MLVCRLLTVGVIVPILLFTIWEQRYPQLVTRISFQAPWRALRADKSFDIHRAALESSEGEVLDLGMLGKLQGTRLDAGVHEYLGVPYAEPPVGSLRFRPSRSPRKGWKGTLQATTFGAACIQAAGNTHYRDTSENCLYMNIWAALRNEGVAPWPVLAWIHGGAFIVGSGQDYNGSYLASTGLVVVTFNYRLGGLGFYASKALAKEDETFPSNGGMNGIGDQILALKWVKDNIFKFGGDPTHVTLAGESSGGISVCYLMHAPAAQGLFHQAVAESGSCVITHASGLPYPASQAEGTSIGWDLEYGCIPGLWTLDCMRKVPAHNLTKGAWFGLRPSIDGVVMPSDPYDLPLSIVPQGFVAGSTSMDTVCAPPWDDGSGTGPARTKPWPADCEDYKKKLAAIFDEDEAAVEHRYPCPENATRFLVAQQWLKLSRDVSISCPTRWLANKVLADGGNGSARTVAYLYEFAYNPDPDWDGLATHGAELGYVWNDRSVGYFPNKNWDSTLAKHMSNYWSSFARNGEPHGSVKWAQYDQFADHFLQFDSDIDLMSGYHTGACNFWQDYLRKPDSESRSRERYKKMVNQCFN